MGDPILGQRIREAREAAGLTQKALSDLVGLQHPQSISNYERGLTEVPPDRLRKIATATSHSLAFFLDADPEPVEPTVMGEMVALRGEVAEVRGMVAELLGRSA